MVELEREERATTLSDLWMGSNLQYKGIQEVVTALQKLNEKRKELTTKEVASEWEKLASVMKGV